MGRVAVGATSVFCSLSPTPQSPPFVPVSSLEEGLVGSEHTGAVSTDSAARKCRGQLGSHATEAWAGSREAGAMVRATEGLATRLCPASVHLLIGLPHPPLSSSANTSAAPSESPVIGPMRLQKFSEGFFPSYLSPLKTGFFPPNPSCANPRRRVCPLHSPSPPLRAATAPLDLMRAVPCRGWLSSAHFATVPMTRIVTALFLHSSDCDHLRDGGVDPRAHPDDLSACRSPPRTPAL